MSQDPGIDHSKHALTRNQCILILVVAFLGWMCAGWQLAISSLAMRDAAADLLHDDFVEAGIAETSTGDESVDEANKKDRESLIGQWFGRLICAFLLGAALGGYVLGWVGDRYGRSKAMAVSILWYSLFSALTVTAGGPWQLVAMRFLTCMGVGGMWPNGIALVSEAWPNMSRPILAGAIGTAANFGIMMLSWLSSYKDITEESWHWIMILGATPALLGLFALVGIPESPKWLALRRGDVDTSKPPKVGLGEIFTRPMLGITILGITLGTIPLFGGWGCSNWVMPWAAQSGDPSLKAQLLLARSLTGTVSSLLGGGLAMLIGRRLCYFLLSLGSLVSAQVLFWFYTPDSHRTEFLIWYGILGFFSGFFFGWLPYCLPELFPTRVRSTGAGVSFNWGRILTALGVLSAGELLHQFEGDYARIGKITSLVYALGLVVVFFMPDTSKRQLDE